MSIEDGTHAGLKHMGSTENERKKLKLELGGGGGVATPSDEEITQGLTAAFQRINNVTVFAYSSTAFEVSINIYQDFPDLRVFLNVGNKTSTMIKHVIYNRDGSFRPDVPEIKTGIDYTEYAKSFVNQLKEKLSDHLSSDFNRLYVGFGRNRFESIDLDGQHILNPADPFTITPDSDMARTERESWVFSIRLKFKCMRDTLIMDVTYNAKKNSIKLGLVGYSTEYYETVKDFVSSWNRSGLKYGTGQVSLKKIFLEQLRATIMKKANQANSIWTVLKNTFKTLYNVTNFVEDSKSIVIDGMSDNFTLTIKTNNRALRLTYPSEDVRTIEDINTKLWRFKKEPNS